MLPNVPRTDHHTIETPEQMSLHLAVAGVGSRFLAMAIDTLIQIFLLLACLLLLAVVTAGDGLVGAGEFRNWLLAAYGVGAFVLFYGYFAIYEILWNGQTPGKRYVGIRVIKDTGRPLTAGETIGRNLMRIVDQLPVFYAVGIVAALLTSQHKRLGDLVVGSILVRETSLAELKPLWQAPIASNVGTPLDTTGLAPQELALIETFLSRRHSLEQSVREKTAAQIVARLRANFPLDVDTNMPAESILETLSYQKRATGHLQR